MTILREELAERKAAAGLQDGLQKAKALGRQSAEKREQVVASLEAAESLARQQRHQFRNHLNSATIGLALVQRQLQLGQVAQAELTLAKISGGIGQIAAPARAGDFPGGRQSAACHRQGRRSQGGALVEDDHNECELLAGFFRLAGYQVATATDGCDALDYLHEHECPDVLLLDMMLPRCDGPTTVRRLRDEPAFNDLKIFAISGHTPDEVGFDYRASGVARWFQKPLNPELLLRELNATRLATVAV